MKKQTLIVILFFLAAGFYTNAQIAVGSTVTTHACENDCNGAITFTFDPNGGFSFTKQLDGPGGENTSFMGNTISGLCVGEYTLTIIDDMTLDYGITTFTIGAETPLMFYDNLMVMNNYCPTTCMAVIDAPVFGGIGSYTYSWTPAVSTGPYAEFLCAGDYTVTVTDDAGCSVTQSTTVTIFEDFITSTSYTNTSCLGACDGIIEPQASGGVFDYSYTWYGTDPNAPVPGIDLCAGEYTVVIADGNGCEITHTVEIADGPACKMQSPTTSVNTYNDRGDSWTVYPNPGKDLIQLTNNEAIQEQYTVEIVNAIGQVVYYTTSVSNTTAMDVSSLESGFYFVKIYQGNKSTVKQIALSK